MAHVGQNMKWIIDAGQRERLHAMFTRGLGCTTVSPSDDWEIYKLADGSGVAVNYVTTPTLGRDQYELAPWLEFLVDDVNEAATTLRGLGVEPVAFEDKEHPYFRAPGGPVFRLAPHQAH